MVYFSKIFVVAFVLSLPAVTRADLIGLYQPNSANSGVIDLGNIASDGTGGRQIVMRPTEPEDTGMTWKFFPPHFQLPDVFPDPTPATPAQQSYYLLEHSPLILAIPQLAHFPSGASIGVTYSVDNKDIIVDATLRDLGYVTATIYGPHEYLLPIAGLNSGEYHLTFNLIYSSVYSDQVTQTSGFIEFAVHPVPEPTFIAYCCSGLLLVCASGRFASRNRPTSIWLL